MIRVKGHLHQRLEKKYLPQPLLMMTESEKRYGGSLKWAPRDNTRVKVEETKQKKHNGGGDEVGCSFSIHPMRWQEKGGGDLCLGLTDGWSKRSRLLARLLCSFLYVCVYRRELTYTRPQPIRIGQPLLYSCIYHLTLLPLFFYFLLSFVPCFVFVREDGRNYLFYAQSRCATGSPLGYEMKKGGLWWWSLFIFFFSFTFSFLDGYNFFFFHTRGGLNSLPLFPPFLFFSNFWKCNKKKKKSETITMKMSSFFFWGGGLSLTKFDTKKK